MANQSAPEAATPPADYDTPTPTPPPAAGPTGGPLDGHAKKRRADKQAGATKVGRTQVFTAHTTEEHLPTVCACCGQPLSATAPAVSYTSFQSLDLHWGDPAAPGLRLHIIDHRYLEETCPCGHHTRTLPAQGDVAAELGAVSVEEWRLVGPGLARLSHRHGQTWALAVEPSTIGRRSSRCSTTPICL